MAAPKHALQKNLLDGLRYLIREVFKLNQPQASDGWLTQDALWLVSKTAADKLRAHLLTQGFEGIPTANPALFNVMQEHAIVLASPDGKAVWCATVRGDNGWTQGFTFLRLSPALIWEPDQRPEPFAGVVSTTSGTIKEAAPIVQQGKQPVKVEAPITLEKETGEASEEIEEEADFPEMPYEFNPLASEIDEGGGEGDGNPVSVFPGELGFRSCSTTTVDPNQVGEHFVEWLRQGLSQFRFAVNSTDSFVHVVDGTAFIVTPKVFKRYAFEHPLVKMHAEAEQLEDWQWV
jgi:hypothetical protein